MDKIKTSSSTEDKSLIAKFTNWVSKKMAQISTAQNNPKTKCSQ